MKKILIRAPNWIGDQILAYPFFREVRRRHPDAHITSVCTAWVKELQFQKQVDRVIELPSMKDRSWWQRLSLLEKVSDQVRRDGPYELGYCLPDSFSSAYLLFRSNVRKRIGYRLDGRGFLLTESPRLVAPLGSGLTPYHRSVEYLRLLDSGINEMEKLVNFSAQDEWGHSADTRPMQKPYWIAAPGATADSRRWPMEHWIELARIIKDKMGISGLVVGGPKEVPFALRICEADGTGMKDRCGMGSVDQLFPWFRHAEFTVTNESGLSHLSSLSGGFTQIVCGAADPRRTQPLGPGYVQVALQALPCWPCEKNVCWRPEPKTNECLRRTSAEEVFDQIQLGLKRMKDKKNGLEF